MEISKAIVEAIYAEDPPGRFLKKCSKTGQWSELSRRDAADKAAQAMAYVIKGESLKEKRRLRRFNLTPSSKADGDVGGKSPKKQQATKNDLKSNHLSPVRGGAGGTSNDALSSGAGNLLQMPGNSNLQQQLLLQQLNQANSNSTFPASLNGSINNNQSLNQNGLGPLQLQMLQQQLPFQLQYNNLVQNPLAQVLQSQTGLQPAFNGGLNPQLLNQSQQQQQQQLLLQSLSNQQNNVLPSSSVPTTLLPAGAGLSNAPQGSQQMDQLQLSLMLQQQQNNNQLLGSPLGTSSNIQLPFQQQQLMQQPLNQLLQQTMQAPLPLQLQQNLQGSIPPSGINSAGVASGNTSTDQTDEAGGGERV
jgi:hypothetical protein